MANVATALHVKLAVFWFASCSTPFVTVSATGPFTSNRVDDCNKWHTTVASAIAAVHPFAIVQASGLGTAHAFTATQYNAWMAGWTQLGNQLKAKAPTAQRYLLSSTPYLKMPVPQCLAAHTTSVKSCAFTNVPSTGTTYGFSLENNLARDTQAATAMSAKLVNVVPLVCVKNVCPAVIGSSMVYADTDHFTVQINNDLSAALGLLLARAGLK
jgi:hypothetical protein